MAKSKKTEDDKMLLAVQERTIFGKKLKKLRYEGVIPANVYGPQFKSKAVTVNYKDFVKLYKKAKETAVIYLQLAKEEIPVLIKIVQKHPVLDTILHIDFRKIDLTQKIVTEVPVHVIGISEAVSQKAGVLLTQTDRLSVEALPQHIPQAIEVDISVIKEIGQEIKVGDLKKSADYLVKDDPHKVVISVIAHKEESITPETTAAAAPEVLTEKVAEGEVPAEGAPAAPAEKGKKPEAAPAGSKEPAPGQAQPAKGKVEKK